MNLKQLAKHIGIEPEEFSDLLDLFTSESASDIKALKTAIEHRNYHQAGDIIHSIKGAALNLALYELCDRLEKLSFAVKKKQPDDISRNLRTVKHIVSKYIEINKKM